MMGRSGARFFTRTAVSAATRRARHAPPEPRGRGVGHHRSLWCGRIQHADAVISYTTATTSEQDVERVTSPKGNRVGDEVADLRGDDERRCQQRLEMNDHPIAGPG